MVIQWTLYNKLKISEIGDVFAYLWYKTKINKSHPLCSPETKL